MASAELSGIYDRSVDTLSGGERQRVALLRALVWEPDLVLLDEPLSNVDEQVKKGLLDWMRSVHEKSQLPWIYVTHDAAEAPHAKR